VEKPALNVGPPKPVL